MKTQLTWLVAVGLMFSVGCAGKSAEPRTAADEDSSLVKDEKDAQKSAEERKKREKEDAKQAEKDRKRQEDEAKRIASEGRGDFDRGLMSFRNHDLAGAKSYFEKAIAAEPTKAAGAYANLGTVLYVRAKESGDKALYAEAVGKLQRALAIESDNMVAYATLALVYFQTAEGDRSKLKLAELVTDEAKKINDKYAPIYNTRGLIQLKLKNVSGALKEFEKAAELDPKFVEAHLNIGAIGLSSRSYQKAEASFSQVLKLQSNNVDATIGMGVAARGQKKIDEAEKWYKKAGELDAKACAVPYNLGLLYQDYKATPEDMKVAQNYFRSYMSCGRAEPGKVADSQKRIKDIDDTFAAIEQQKKLEAENARIMEEAKRQEEAAKKAASEQPAPAPTPAK